MWQQARGRSRPGPTTPGHSLRARLSSAGCASRRHLTATASGVGLENNHLDSELFPLSFVVVVFNRSVFLAYLPPLYFLSCRCENVKGARPKLSPGKSFELVFCTMQFQRDYTPPGLEVIRGCRYDPAVLAAGLECSCEPQAAVPAPRGAPGLSQGHRDGGEDCVSLTRHHSG